MTKNPAPALLVLAAALAAVSCAPRQAPTGRKDRPLIGFAMDSFVEERWLRDRDVFTATAASLGAAAIIQVAEEDERNQEAQIGFMVSQGIDALVLVAADPDYPAKMVQDLKKRGIPVILYERIVRNAGADLYLAYDAARTGELQARAIVDRIGGSGTIALYNGAADDANAAAAHEGIMKVLGPLVEAGRVRIAFDYWAKAPSSEDAFGFMERLLSSGIRPNGVIAYNDLYAEAIIRSLSLRRMAGSVAVAGADADLAACQRIAEGSQAMTVYKPIDQIAAKAAELAVYMIKHDRFTVHNAVQDGTYRVPYYELEPVPVTADRLKETVIKDGFHLEEDVYRNVLTK